jgi:hypothetical protein
VRTAVFFAGRYAVSERAPKGLGAVGRRVWKQLHEPREDGAVLEFRADERPLVVEFVRLADDCERIRAALGDELLAVGSKGQLVAHPLRVELHRTSQRLESIAKTLGLPDEGDAGGAWAGRRLARARWSASA